MGPDFRRSENRADVGNGRKPDQYRESERARLRHKRRAQALDEGTPMILGFKQTFN